MAIARKKILELTEAESLIYRAICGEIESIADTITEEASCPNPDFVAIAAAQRDRRLAIWWLRKLNLPAASVYCDGPTEADETRLLLEAGA